MKLDVIKLDASPAGSIELDDGIFGLTPTTFLRDVSSSAFSILAMIAANTPASSDSSSSSQPSS